MTTQPRKDKLIGVRLQTTTSESKSTIIMQKTTFVALRGASIEVRLFQEGEDGHQPSCELDDAEEEVNPAYMRSGAPEAKTGLAMLGCGRPRRWYPLVTQSL